MNADQMIDKIWIDLIMHTITDNLSPNISLSALTIKCYCTDNDG